MPINDDWLYRWRDYAGEVSSEDLQNIWGKRISPDWEISSDHFNECYFEKAFA